MLWKREWIIWGVRKSEIRVDFSFLGIGFKLKAPLIGGKKVTCWGKSWNNFFPLHWQKVIIRADCTVPVAKLWLCPCPACLAARVSWPLAERCAAAEDVVVCSYLFCLTAFLPGLRLGGCKLCSCSELCVAIQREECELWKAPKVSNRTLGIAFALVSAEVRILHAGC